MGAPDQREGSSQTLSQTQAVTLLFDYIAGSNDLVNNKNDKISDEISIKDHPSAAYRISYRKEIPLQRTLDEPRLTFPFGIYIFTWL